MTRSRLPLIAIVVGAALVVCSTASGDWLGLCEPLDEESRPSLKGTAMEFSRGVVNVAFCWLEIPHEIEHRVREDRSDGLFDFVSSAFNVASGAVCGTLKAAGRGCNGCVEMLLSPFPPYGPLTEPALPPYLRSISPDESPQEARPDTPSGSA